MTTITLNIDNLQPGTAALYRQYPGQVQPQPAYVTLEEDGAVSADWSSLDRGSTPMRVYNGRDLRWSVQPHVDPKALADYLRGDGLPLLQRVLDGLSVDWDGNDHCGTLTADADAADEQIERDLERLPVIGVWALDDWLTANGSNRLSDVWQDGQTLDAAVAANRAEIDRMDAGDGVVLGDDSDLRAALLDFAEGEFDRGRALSEIQLQALLADERITAEALADYREELNA